MRNARWLVATLLFACSSSMPGGSSTPDADVEEDDVDARPRADARQPADAPLGGGADAPVGGGADAPAGGGPDARIADAAAGMADAQMVLAVRPWNGPTAKLRALDLRMFGPETGIKLCVFDADNDPRPYAVVIGRGLSGSAPTVAATYAEVPADSGLRASVHTFTVLGGAQPDMTPAGCDQSKAIQLRGASGLTEDGYYTATYDTTDPFFAQCEISEEDGCQFYPQYNGETADMCAADGLRVFRDAHLGSSGYRLINMTADAALLSHTPSLGLKIEVRHVNIPFNFAEVYEDTIPGEQTFICPEYVGCMGADLEVTPFTECTSGESAWIVGEINEPRIADDAKFTSFYLVGDVRDLASDASGLVGPAVTVVTALDGAD